MCTLLDLNVKADVYSEALSGAILCGIKLAPEISEVGEMEAVVIGAAFLGSFATAFVVQKAVLGAMFRAMHQSKQVRP